MPSIAKLASFTGTFIRAAFFVSSAFVAVAIEAFNGVKRIRRRSVDILPVSNQCTKISQAAFSVGSVYFWGIRLLKLHNQTASADGGVGAAEGFQLILPEPKELLAGRRSICWETS
jgi:hypothetical protein